MQLLGTEAYRDKLATQIGEATKSLALLSAYVTVPGIKWVVDRLHGKNVEVDLVVRWRPDDLLSGASDLEVYDIVKDLGWNLYLSPELHAKAVLVDEKELLLGSANITGSGLALVPGGNSELGVKLDAKLRDVAALYAIRDESVLVTDELFEAIKNYIHSLPKGEKTLESSWSPTIQRFFEKAPERLWVADLFWTSPLESTIAFAEDDVRSIDHDSRMLGFEEGVEQATREKLSQAFLTSRAWRWLNKLILANEERCLFFGTITAHLHATLLDDPTPYRKDVKGLVQNLFSWIKFLELPGVEIDQPGRRSERIRAIF